MSSRPSAMTAAGFVLSHATRQTSPSKRWPRATSSIESAITSRETSEARIPSVPIETPSEIEIVLNSSGVPPASRMPSLTSCASSRWLRLHGIVSIHVVATPISGFARSSSVKPTPFSIERAPARSGPSVIARLCRFAGSVGRSYGVLISSSLYGEALARPLAPRARIEAGVGAAGLVEGEQRGARGDARAAVGDDLLRVEKLGGEVGSCFGGQAERARDVTRNGVEVLALALEAPGRTGI